MTVKGQVTLEFTLVFIIVVALLVGLLGLWKWSSDNIIKRQVDYNAKRPTAGQIIANEEPPSTYEAEKMQKEDVYLFK